MDDLGVPDQGVRQVRSINLKQWRSGTSVLVNWTVMGFEMLSACAKAA